MKVTYDKKLDLLYIRLDETKQDVINACASFPG